MNSLKTIFLYGLKAGCLLFILSTAAFALAPQLLSRRSAPTEEEQATQTERLAPTLAALQTIAERLQGEIHRHSDEFLRTHPFLGQAPRTQSEELDGILFSNMQSLQDHVQKIIQATMARLANPEWKDKHNNIKQYIESSLTTIPPAALPQELQRQLLELATSWDRFIHEYNQIHAPQIQEERSLQASEEVSVNRIETPEALAIIRNSHKRNDQVTDTKLATPELKPRTKITLTTPDGNNLEYTVSDLFKSEKTGYYGFVLYFRNPFDQEFPNSYFVSPIYLSYSSGSWRIPSDVTERHFGKGNYHETSTDLPIAIQKSLFSIFHQQRQSYIQIRDNNGPNIIHVLGKQSPQSLLSEKDLEETISIGSFAYNTHFTSYTYQFNEGFQPDWHQLATVQPYLSYSFGEPIESYQISSVNQEVYYLFCYSPQDHKVWLGSIQPAIDVHKISRHGLHKRVTTALSVVNSGSRELDLAMGRFEYPRQVSPDLPAYVPYSQRIRIVEKSGSYIDTRCALTYQPILREFLRLKLNNQLEEAYPQSWQELAQRNQAIAKKHLSSIETPEDKKAAAIQILKGLFIPREYFEELQTMLGAQQLREREIIYTPNAYHFPHLFRDVGSASPFYSFLKKFSDKIPVDDRADFIQQYSPIEEALGLYGTIFTYSEFLFKQEQAEYYQILQSQPNFSQTLPLVFEKCSSATKLYILEQLLANQKIDLILHLFEITKIENIVLFEPEEQIRFIAIIQNIQHRLSLAIIYKIFQMPRLFDHDQFVAIFSLEVIKQGIENLFLKGTIGPILSLINEKEQNRQPYREAIREIIPLERIKAATHSIYKADLERHLYPETQTRARSEREEHLENLRTQFDQINIMNIFQANSTNSVFIFNGQIMPLNEATANTIFESIIANFQEDLPLSEYSERLRRLERSLNQAQIAGVNFEQVFPENTVAGMYSQEVAALSQQLRQTIHPDLSTIFALNLEHIIHQEYEQNSSFYRRICQMVNSGQVFETFEAWKNYYKHLDEEPGKHTEITQLISTPKLVLHFLLAIIPSQYHSDLDLAALEMSLQLMPANALELLYSQIHKPDSFDASILRINSQITDETTPSEFFQIFRDELGQLFLSIPQELYVIDQNQTRKEQVTGQDGRTVFLKINEIYGNLNGFTILEMLGLVLKAKYDPIFSLAKQNKVFDFDDMDSILEQQVELLYPQEELTEELFQLKLLQLRSSLLARDSQENKYTANALFAHFLMRLILENPRADIVAWIPRDIYQDWKKRFIPSTWASMLEQLNILSTPSYQSWREGRHLRTVHARPAQDPRQASLLRRHA